MYPASTSAAAGDGEGDGEAAEGHHQEEGEQEVDTTHGYGEGADDEVAVAHADDAELLLEPADEEPDQQSGQHGHQADEHPLGEEGAPQLPVGHPHAAEDEDVATLVDDQQREGGDEAQRGYEHDEREDEVDAEPLGAEYLEVEGLLVVAVFDGEGSGGLTVGEELDFFLGFPGVGAGTELEGEGGALVGGVVHQLADEGDVAHHEAAVDVLLDEEVGGGVGVGDVEGLVHRETYRGGAALGDVDGGRGVGEEVHAEFVEDVGADDDAVGLASGEAEKVLPFVEEGVEARDGAIVAVDAAKGYDGLAVGVGDPGGFGGDLRHLGNAADRGEVEVGGAEGLAPGGFDDEFGVEGVEEGLGEFADAVVDGEDDDQRGSAHEEADEGNPRDDVDYRLLAAGEKVADGDKGLELHCFSRRSMFSI